MMIKRNSASCRQNETYHKLTKWVMKVKLGNLRGDVDNA